MKKRILGGASVLFGFLLAAAGAQAAIPLQSLYGALYYSSNLTSAAGGSNNESILLYDPSSDGFTAITTNQANGPEIWTSDELGLIWTRAENPLDELNCTQPGRHSAVLYDGAYYFGVSCDAGAYVFKLTGPDTIEQIHFVEKEEPGQQADDDLGDPPGDNPGDEPGGDDQQATCNGFPTATVLNEKLYMFCNGGYVEYDGTTASYVTDAPGQPESVPLEASAELNAEVYLAGSGNVVTAFDGSEYRDVGTVEGAGLLPAVGVLNGSVYVGDMNAEEGAAIYKLNEDGEFDLLFQLDAEEEVVNKMQVTDDGSHLVFYTGNGTKGTSIYAINEEDELVTLVDNGLGSERPENNREVVSILTRTVTDGDEERDIMLFGTQNNTDQTKIFVLNIGEDLAIEADKKDVLSALVSGEKGNNEEKIAEFVTQAKKKSKVVTTKGKVFKYRVKKAQVNPGDKFILYVNGEEVDTVTATKSKNIMLKYKKAKKLKASKTFTVRVGVQRAYGQGDDRQLSTNVVKGRPLTITVRKKKN